jgi:hypothetical protein
VEPYELIDHDCGDATVAGQRIQAEVRAAGFVGESAFVETLRRVNEYAHEHKGTCPRCRGFQPRAGNRQSAAWGGATIGVLVGLGIGYFRQDYLASIAISVAVGSLLGFILEAISGRAA